MIVKLKDLKQELKRIAARTFWAYGSDELVKRLRQCGVVPGTTLMFHSSWNPFGGFQGKPADVVRALKQAVGPEGLLVMPSMPYHNMSSAQWLAKGKAMNVSRTPSMMGLISEVFRRSEGVRRSLSPTHPLIAWGRDADAFVGGHERALKPFGAESPFARLLERNALILGFDATFSSFTFTHFVEDQVCSTIPVPLYEPEPMQGNVIDYEGNARTIDAMVLSARANALRREHRLQTALENGGVLKASRIGNTRLVYIRAADLSDGALSMVAKGEHFFDFPEERN